MAPQNYEQFRRAYIALHCAIEIGNPDADNLFDAARDYARGTQGLTSDMMYLQSMTLAEVFQLATKLRKQEADNNV